MAARPSREAPRPCAQVQLDLDALQQYLARAGIVTSPSPLGSDAPVDATSSRMGQLQMLDVKLSTRDANRKKLARSESSDRSSPVNPEKARDQAKAKEKEEEMVKERVKAALLRPLLRHRRSFSEPLSPMQLRRSRIVMSGWLFRYYAPRRTWRRKWFELLDGGQLRW